MSIRVENLSKIYGQQKAVNNLTFKVNSGEIVGFLGPNGAGKTTTMKILTCFIPPTFGKAFINDLDVEENSIEVRRQIGYLPEHNPLYMDMYVKEFLSFVASTYQIKQTQKRVQEMIELTGLQVEQKKKIGQLSKGYRQRVGLAQAMIHNPSVLILDEPTSGLDPNQIIEIRNLIKTIGKDKTVMLSTHIMQEVEAMCNRVMIINKGNIVADGNPAELKQSFKKQLELMISFGTPLTNEQINQLNAFGNVKAIDDLSFVINSDMNEQILKKELFNFAVNHQNTISEMKVNESTLEDLFKNVTQ
ncbi:MAG: gliding motility-associated ABC transporter ATP-binding subunit GldA [Bacteroidota bacterium]|nr:gliding motility-associated ABC transporter ATP-binding subunit GldA [Bacteroidota bacterium]